MAMRKYPMLRKKISHINIDVYTIHNDKTFITGNEHWTILSHVKYFKYIYDSLINMMQ